MSENYLTVKEARKIAYPDKIDLSIDIVMKQILIDAKAGHTMCTSFFYSKYVMGQKILNELKSLGYEIIFIYKHFIVIKW